MALLSTTSRIDPNGFHPTFHTNISSTNWTQILEDYRCDLHVHYTLPVEVFVDTYELENYRVNGHGYNWEFEHYGMRNLELPVIALGYDAESYLLLHIDTTEIVKERSWEGRCRKEIVVPMHIRYGELNEEGVRGVDVPWPEVFIACEESVPHWSLTPHTSSFPDFSTKTHRYHPTLPIKPRSETLLYPVGTKSDLLAVQCGTVLTILVCFCYLVYAALRTARRLWLGTGGTVVVDGALSSGFGSGYGKTRREKEE